MEPLSVSVKNQVATLTLSRPKVYNSFNRDMALALQNALDQCKNDPEVRAIYLTGAGKAFCARQDLQEVLAEDAPSLAAILEQHLNPIIQKIRAIEKPIVCGVNGVAAGAGANIAIACDITVASEKSSFIQAFVKIGLIPDSGGTYILPRLIGWQRAAALMMLGEKISAEEAAQMGMIYKVLPAENFEAEALAIAERLAQMPTAAIGEIKSASHGSATTATHSQGKGGVSISPAMPTPINSMHSMPSSSNHSMLTQPCVVPVSNAAAFQLARNTGTNPPMPQTGHVHPLIYQSPQMMYPQWQPHGGIHQWNLKAGKKRGTF